MNYLIGRFERGVGVLDQHLDVLVEPCSSLRSRDLSIRTLTVLVKSLSSLVTSPITLPRRLGPNNCIDDILASLRRRPNTKSSVIDITPVTTTSTDVLLTAAALVNDEMGGKTLSFEVGLEGFGVAEFGPVWVVRTGAVDGVGSGRVVAVVVGDVCGKATDFGGVGGVGSIVVGEGDDFGEEAGCGLEVAWPAEPVAVSSVLRME